MDDWVKKQLKKQYTDETAWYVPVPNHKCAWGDRGIERPTYCFLLKKKPTDEEKLCTYENCVIKDIEVVKCNGCKKLFTISKKVANHRRKIDRVEPICQACEQDETKCPYCGSSNIHKPMIQSGPRPLYCDECLDCKKRFNFPRMHG